LLFAQTDLDHNPLLHFSPSMGFQAHTTTPGFLPLRWARANFFAWAGPECNPPGLSLPGSQDYRCEPRAPGFAKSFTQVNFQYWK
jgi:hypothetical protein